LLLILFLLGGRSSTWSKSLNFVVSNLFKMKFGRNVLQVNTHRLMESDFWFDVTLYQMAAMKSFHAAKCCHLVKRSTCPVSMWQHSISSWSIELSYLFTCVCLILLQNGIPRSMVASFSLLKGSLHHCLMFRLCLGHSTSQCHLDCLVLVMAAVLFPNLVVFSSTETCALFTWL